MDRIYDVARLLSQGKSDSYICRTLKIKPRSLTAFKANITKRVNSRAHSPYLVIPSENLGRLSARQYAAFLDILETLNGADGGLEKKVVSSEDAKTERAPNGQNGYSTLPESRIREIVIELRRKGIPSNRVYLDSRLKSVPKTSIASYNAHYTRGSYSLERH
jgi:hypothetical protein